MHCLRIPPSFHRWDTSSTIMRPSSRRWPLSFRQCTLVTMAPMRRIRFGLTSAASCSTSLTCLRKMPPFWSERATSLVTKPSRILMSIGTAQGTTTIFLLHRKTAVYSNSFTMRCLKLKTRIWMLRWQTMRSPMKRRMPIWSRKTVALNSRSWVSQAWTRTQWLPCTALWLSSLLLKSKLLRSAPHQSTSHISNRSTTYFSLPSITMCSSASSILSMRDS